jgi:hypothetical protein
MAFGLPFPGNRRKRSVPYHLEGVAPPTPSAQDWCENEPLFILLETADLEHCQP